MENVLKNRSFFFMWIGSAISELGGAFGTLCNSILVYELTGSKTALSSMWLLYFIPSLILQLISGPFIDKWSRKWIMIFSQWMRASVFLLPLVMLVTNSVEVWHIYVVQIIIGLITPLYTPASQGITPSIVSKEQLQDANAYIDGMTRLMMFLAPVLGGIVIHLIGMKLTLFFVCICLFISGGLLLFVREKRIKQELRKTWLEEFLHGFTYFFTKPVIVWLGVFLTFVQFGVGVTMVTNLPYIKDELSAGYAEYGYFMAGFPLGYVVGSMLVGKVKYKSRRLLMLGGLFVGGLTYISLGLNNSIIIAIVIEVIAGICIVFFNVHNTTICQQTVPNNMIGKVFSVRLFFIRSAMPLGVFLGGILSEMWGVRILYFIIGSIICVTSLIGILLPYFKFLDESIAEKSA
ncbi:MULTISPECIES: MFS transporter [Bacillus]|uniref:Tetracycline resistance determinant TetV n=2 Tax=Bacillus cereus group TaxID=86661 RepID=R8QFB1_BACCE|nr:MULTISPECIES: MFS transporter [Bacillus cereus group]EOP69509.1 tetracycline resistance determinant TetV [Bacillus cereus VD118]MBJ8091264.1 MFS transporter [Bacillus cereus]MCQ6355537.1 MFS transporter [Bacillus cereus]CAH2464061.1 Transmembrane secretion effector [Bacillus mycoides KBAB4]SCB68699.1 Tetracycline resistance determinant TetV [Bacillus mycoides]